MTWARTIATGSGKVAYRLQIEGIQYEFVTDSTMARSLSDGRSRVVGLLRDGIREGEKIDIARATVDGGSFDAKIADISGIPTLQFEQRPTKQTWMTANLSTTGTSMTVASSAGWVSGDMVYVGTETMKVDGSPPDSTHLNLVAAGTRTAQWDSIAQAHYATSGVSGGALPPLPIVTNRPLTMQGRRCKLFAYGEGDDPQGNGTQVLLGRCKTGARLDSIATWSITIESITAILDQELGADTEDPVTPRGIYYPWSSPLVLTVQLLSNGLVTGSVDSDGVVKVFGFYESQEDFVAEVNTQLAFASGWATSVRAEVCQDGWQITITTASASPKYVRIYKNGSPIDEHTDVAFLASDADGQLDEVVANQTAYKRFRAAVPRGVYGRPADPGNPAADPYQATTYPNDRVYLAGAFTPDALTVAALVDWPEAGGKRHTFPSPDGYHSADRWVRLRPWSTRTPDTHAYVAYGGALGLPTLRFGRSYNSLGFAAPGGGTLTDLLTTITTNSATYMNLGSMPDLRSTDFDLTEIATTVAAASAGSQYLSARDYYSFAPKKLSEALAAEAQILGCYWCLSSSGTLTLKRVSVPGIGDVSDSIDANDQVGFPKLEISDPKGPINTIRLHTNYDPVEDQHGGPPVTVRFMPGLSVSKTANAAEIKPVFEGAGDLSDSASAAVRSAMGIFAILGFPYDIVYVDVPFTKHGVRCGSTVSLTSAQLPNSSGTRGVTNAPALVIAREFRHGTARGSLTLLYVRNRVRGYAPAMRIASASNTAGTTWSLTLDAAPPSGGSVNYLPDHAPNASDWFEVGDRIRIWQWDATSPTVRVGTVDSVAGLLMTVTLTAAWGGLGSDEYILGYNVASTAGLQSGQREYAFMAGTDLLVDFTSAEPATELGA